MFKILILLIKCHLCARLALCQVRPVSLFQAMAGGSNPAISLFFVNKVLLRYCLACSFTYVLPSAAFVLKGGVE